MTTANKKIEDILWISLILLIGTLGIMLLTPDIAVTNAVNPLEVRNQINITNAPPFVFNITFPGPINLEANSSVFITCNATVRDYNNVTDINRVNATLYDISIENQYSTAYTNRTKYYTTCTNINQSHDAAYESLYTCNFTVMYWSNPSAWTCNVTATDFDGLTHADNASATINTLVAISSASVLNYGDIGVTETTGNTFLNLSIASESLLVLG